jgi:hypothetical protein
MTTVESTTAGARLVDVPTPSAPTDQQPDDHESDHHPESSSTDLADTAADLPDPLEPATRTTDPLAGLERVGATMRDGRDRRRVDVRLMLASFGIAIGVVVVVLGVLRSVTGREQQGLPDAIETIDPIRGATQVPQQTRVFVDLVNGYEAIMLIDGLELDVFSLDGDVGQAPPALGGDQEEVIVPPGAIYEPGNNTLTFTPGPSQPIEAFRTGLHTVTIRYWLTADGPGRFRTFNWTFYVV